MKIRITSMALVLLVAFAAWIAIRSSPIGTQLNTGTGIAAKQLCSLVFVSKLDPGRARALYVDPLLAEATSIMWIQIDRQQQSVTARVPGIATQRARHRPGYGCTLEVDRDLAWQPPPGPKPDSPEMVLNTRHRDEFFDTAMLTNAIDRSFADPSNESRVNTLAVVVMQDGRLVAERYAEGITSNTRLPGWSMAKSITATLIGILVHQNELDVFAPGAIARWRDSKDPRARISLDHLLRMTSGLALTEDQSGIDPNSQMMFREPNAALYAATQPLQQDVGSHFEYMSGNTVLAMRRFQEAVGGDVREAHDFMQRHFFEPLNMRSAVFEPDQAGTFLGFSYVLATARDWARFGNLYLNRGTVGRRRLLADHWIDYVSALTEESRPQGYGAGFWLNSVDERAHHEIAAQLPEDMLSANGFQGQYVHIIPSLGLVIVRLGATAYDGRELDRFPRLALDVVRSLKSRDR